MIYFKFKLQLKLRNSKNYSYVIVNFHIDFCWIVYYITIQIQDQKKLSWEKDSFWYIVTSLLLKVLKQHFIQALEITLFLICSVQTHK